MVGGARSSRGCKASNNIPSFNRRKTTCTDCNESKPHPPTEDFGWSFGLWSADESGRSFKGDARWIQ